MLVLNRKLGEVIVISNNITVTVLGVQGGRVKLGLTAPVSMPIRREELPSQVSFRQSNAFAAVEVA